MTRTANDNQRSKTTLAWIKTGASLFLLLAGITLALNEASREPSTTASASAGAASPVDFSALTIEEAIRTASEKLDELETGSGIDDRQVLLDEINRYLLVVQEKDPINIRLLFLQGRVEKEAGRTQNAITYLGKYVDTREGRTDWRAYRLLGDLFVDEYQTLARGHYENARKLNANDPSIAFGLSQCAFKLGEQPEALRLANEAVSADRRRNPKFVAHLTRVLLSMRRWSEAENEALTALNLAQNECRSRPGERAPVETLIGQYDLLIEIMQARMGFTSRTPGASTPAATTMSPDDYLKLAGYVRNRGEAAALLSRHDVLRLLEQAVRGLAPNVPVRVAEQYSVALAEVGRNAAAVTAFENLVKSDPENALAREWLPKLRATTP
jgi:tetratricopeptide (TPR) repeat protein